MEARYLALLILVPFMAVFAYATWHEYKRFKSEGRNVYGLSYDPETNTTHVSAMDEHGEEFDPKDFEPDLLETEAREREDGEDTENAPHDGSDTARHARDTDQPNADDKPQDT